MSCRSNCTACCCSVLCTAVASGLLLLVAAMTSACGSGVPAGRTTLNPAPCRTTISPDSCLPVFKSAGSDAAEAASSEMMVLKVSTCDCTPLLTERSKGPGLAVLSGDRGAVLAGVTSLPAAGACSPPAAGPVGVAPRDPVESLGVRRPVPSPAAGVVARGPLGMKGVSRSFFSSCGSYDIGKRTTTNTICRSRNGIRGYRHVQKLPIRGMCRVA